MQIIEHLTRQLSHFAADQQYVIAYSGGLDSHALLKAMSLWRAQTGDVFLKAVHVHHGLSSKADDWVEHCRRIAGELQIDFCCEYLDGPPPPGGSIEAWARESRYGALAKHMTSSSLLLTAHTQDDQAETLLLQLLRGAGPKGLAAMPQQQIFVLGHLIRPFLDISRRCLQEFAEHHSLIWLEDESNANLRFDRNFIRHRVAPVLRERWPGFAKNIARSAQYNAEAAANLNELALLDLSRIFHHGISGLRGTIPEALPVELLKKLSASRQRNVLRSWLNFHNCRFPNARQMQRIQQDLIYSRQDSQPQVKWGQWIIKRFQQNLIVSPFQTAVADTLAPIHWDLSAPLHLPNGLGYLQAVQGVNGGLSLNIDRQSLTVRFRRGGERCCLQGKSQSTSLKKLFQQWKIPYWQRAEIPLLFHGEELAAIIGYGVCSPFAANKNELAWQLTHPR